VRIVPCDAYQATRTQIRRPSSNTRLSALTAILTPPTRRASGLSVFARRRRRKVAIDAGSTTWLSIPSACRASWTPKPSSPASWMTPPSTLVAFDPAVLEQPQPRIVASSRSSAWAACRQLHPLSKSTTAARRGTGTRQAAEPSRAKANSLARDLACSESRVESRARQNPPNRKPQEISPGSSIRRVDLFWGIMHLTYHY
jgi:hypothetical protein